jgi:hypothetical protein
MLKRQARLCLSSPSEPIFPFLFPFVQVTVVDPRLLIACATTTFATGHGLSVATAGKLPQ